MSDYNHQLHPLEVNKKTGEVFLRLKGHPNVILTPPRDGDPEEYVTPLNDPRVCEWLGGTPFPYTVEHAKAWVEKINVGAQAMLRQLDEAIAKAEEKPVIVDGCPVRVIRQLQPDGTDVFMGDLGVMRCMHGEMMGLAKGVEVDWDNKMKREEENNALPAGDPNIVWSFGDFLAPQYHGQGIMTDAVNTMLNEWCIPRMNAKHMWVSAFTGNFGSVRVFEKNGFVLIKTREEHAEAKGKMRGLHLLEWRL